MREELLRAISINHLGILACEDMLAEFEDMLAENVFFLAVYDLRTQPHEDPSRGAPER